MAKYDPLCDHLRSSGQPRVTMTFDQIAALVGPLPRSAFEYREWWSNEQGGGHVQSHSWQNAGYLVERIDISTYTVTFNKRRVT